MITSIMKPTEKVTGMAMIITAAGTVGRKDRPDGKKCRHFRKKQLQNAFLYVAADTVHPLIFMGDEFGNSSRATIIPIVRIMRFPGWTGRIRGKKCGIIEFLETDDCFPESSPDPAPVEELRILDSLSCGYRICPITDRMPEAPDREL